MFVNLFVYSHIGFENQTNIAESSKDELDASHSGFSKPRHLSFNFGFTIFSQNPNNESFLQRNNTEIKSFPKILQVVRSLSLVLVLIVSELEHNSKFNTDILKFAFEIVPLELSITCQLLDEPKSA